MRLIPTAEVARLLGVSPRTVHRMVDAEQLTPVTRGPGPNGAMLFDPDDLPETARSVA